MDIEKIMMNAGLLSLPPGLQEAVRQTLSTCRHTGPLVVHHHPRSRTVSLANDADNRIAELAVDCATLVYGLSAEHVSDDVDDEPGAQHQVFGYYNNRLIIGDGEEGLSLSALANTDRYWEMYPPLLLAQGSSLKLRVKCGSVEGTAFAYFSFHAITFVGLDLAPQL